MKRVCIVGASGKLGQYLVRHALERGYEVVGVCREFSVGKLDAFKGRIAVIPGATNDREVIKNAVARCDGGLDRVASRMTRCIRDTDKRLPDPSGRTVRNAVHGIKLRLNRHAH